MSEQSARAFWILEPGRGALREEALPEPGPGEVRVRTLHSGLSRGTEALVFEGRVPPSQSELMRAPFQKGDFPGPVKYGYCAVGEVEHGPEELLGQVVFCLHPHQDRFVVPAEAVMPLPQQLPPTRAVLAANMETALNGVWDARMGPGDRVAVVGGGVVGSLVAWLAGRIPGTQVCLIDICSERRELAERLGVGFARPEDAVGERDCVIHASASESGLVTALSLAGDEARVIEMSWYGSRRPRVPLGEAFHPRRLSLVSSQVGQLPQERQARWTHARRMAVALELLLDPALDTLISGASAFKAMAEDFPELLAGEGEILCHRIDYDAA
jgi:threonine dehydrogenase-like Zn-dependent dehydrogenase